MNMIYPTPPLKVEACCQHSQWLQSLYQLNYLLEVLQNHKDAHLDMYNAVLLIYASISWQHILRMKWNKMNLYLWMWQRACMICVVHTRMVIVLYCLYLIESLVYLTIYHIEMSTLKIWIEYCEVLYLKPWLAEVIMSWPWMTMDMCSVKCWTCLIDYNSCLSNWVSKFEIKWQIVLKTFHLNLWFV